MKKLRFLHCLSQHYAELWNVDGPAHKETSNEPETDVGSELPLTSLSVTQPGLAAVKVDNVVTTNFTPWRQRDGLSEWETA